MSRSHIRAEIIDAIPGLLDLVKESCANGLSDHLEYIVSEIRNSELSLDDMHKARIKENELKTPISLAEALDIVLVQHENLYDINLTVYKSERKRTIIEISYYAKSSLDEIFRKTVIHHPPMVHCKVPRPVYADTQQFDVNWEHGGFRHRWKLFWYRFKIN